MGACGSSAPVASKDQIEKDKEITKTLVQEKRRLENEVKLLLLGAGESGKRTVAKQLKIIHQDGFTEEERASYKSIIYNNTVASMRVLVTALENLGLTVQAEHKEAAERIATGEEYFTGEVLTPALAEDIKTCWKDESVRTAYNRSAEFQLNDSAGYYFDNIDRLAAPDYVPSVQDVLRSRAKTTGIIETEFDVEGTHFRLVDVGGQRSERKKWMHCFQDVTAVIFCVAMSEYDLKLYEDDTTNRMHESLKLFKEICNNRWFVDTAIIIFLNKKDLFAEKIKKVDLNVAFPDYDGGLDYDKGAEFLTNKFVSQNENSSKQIYVHITCATDTDNIRVVFKAVQELVLQKAVASSGLGI